MPNPKLRTSRTHPLQIAETPAPGGGMVGVTFCPGKQQLEAWTGGWARSLDLDLRAIKAWGAGVLITLLTEAELIELKVERLGRAAQALGLDWLHLPIADVSTPTAEWERRWRCERGAVHEQLNRGGRVLVHCKGGLGRAGVVAARILIERGTAPQDAIAAVRKVRPGAIQTLDQERYLLRLQARGGLAER